nr:MAG TPA: hypothetical protein [Crassvirales sp.]
MREIEERIVVIYDHLPLLSLFPNTLNPDSR